MWLHGEEGLRPDDAFLDLLAEHGQVLAPSHPGFGHSPDIDGVDTIDDLSYLYLDLLAGRDLRDVVVIGASLGGWIAAEMAVKCTDRLAGLVLMAPMGIKVGDRETPFIRTTSRGCSIVMPRGQSSTPRPCQTIS